MLFLLLGLEEGGLLLLLLGLEEGLLLLLFLLLLLLGEGFLFPLGLEEEELLVELVGLELDGGAWGGWLDPRACVHLVGEVDGVDGR